MGNNSHGFANETEISAYISNKKFYELNGNMQNFLCWLFNRQISPSELIYTNTTKKVNNKNPKPDIVIKIGKDSKNISIKEGSGNSVHQEQLKEFCCFLEKIQISTQTIDNIKLYHYADGTLIGNGKIRMSTSIIKENYSKNIHLINLELNKPENLYKILNRVLFEGVFEQPLTVDAFYHGTIDAGCWASREEVASYLINNIKLNRMKGIQFSILTYQPWTRDENRTAVHPERRHVIQIKWGAMIKCIIEISKGRKNNGNK